MDTSPTEGNPAQALEAWHDDVPGTAGPWRVGKGGTSGGSEQPTLVVQQPSGGTEQRADDCLL